MPGSDEIVVFFGGTLALLLLTGGMVVFVLRYSRRIALHQEELMQQREKQQAEMLEAVLQAQENALRQVSEELHDGLAPDMMAVNQQLFLYKKMVEKGEDTTGQYQTVKEMLRQATDTARHLSHQLTPANIERFGLAATLREVFATMNQTDELHRELQAEDSFVRLPVRDELMLYRIVQELLHNTMKYARASTFTVQLRVEGQQAVMVVSDNGIGFSTTATPANYGIGLKNVESRVQVLGGEWQLTSAPDRGTSFVFKIPFHPYKI
ncbi:MAG: hypothetical protein IPH78_04375 [Bacteroidetes bacterium]|nr:hypothetical protein [Bacteroidota bacterium]